MDQTTFVLDVLEMSREIEDVLACLHWILGVAQAGATFITTDDPVRLQLASGAPDAPTLVPGFDEAATGSEPGLSGGKCVSFSKLTGGADGARTRGSPSGPRTGR